MVYTDNHIISQNLNIPHIEAKNLLKVNGDIVMAICSRAFAIRLLNSDTPNLKVIQLTSAGFDGVDINLARSKSIIVCNAANVYNIGMAEFVVFAMLASAKRYNRSIKNRHLRFQRNYHYITELYGKTVGILGAGNIGSQIAKRLAAFDMHVLGYDLNTEDRPYFEKIYDATNLHELLVSCDYIVNCIPLFKSTEDILCKKWFDLMKDNVTFVNVGRKKTIKDSDFIDFLKKHKNATAILDIFEKVPNPITNPYRRLSNVWVLPGVTAISQEISKRLLSLCENNIDAFKKGEPLINRLWN